ncbi:hypothetical protein [Aquirufa sp. TARAVU-A1A]
MKLVDVTGYGNSGKTAISDYLKDFNNVSSFPNYVEFELFRAKNGLVDLYFSNYDNWGLIRSNYSIIEFKKLVNRIGQDSSRMPFFLGNLTSSGHNYEKLFLNNFIKLSNEYIDSISLFKYKSFWPYQYFYHNSIKMFILKVLRKVQLFDDSALITITSKSEFRQLTNNYINKLFETVIDSNSNIFLLNNSFDFNPIPSLDMLENGYSIIVDRDPRDIYASTINSNDGYIPLIERSLKNNLMTKRFFLGTNNIDQFIYRYKLLRSNENLEAHSRIFRLRFEDFVLSHEEFSEKLNVFLNLNSSDKKTGNLLFDPALSVKNIGIWKKYRDLPEIAKIEKELAEFCYQS